jgi:predicted amidohydrolase
MRIALGQINPTVGDLPGNLALMLGFAKEAAARYAELIVFPELSVTGYPPRDLVEKPSFIERFLLLWLGHDASFAAWAAARRD